MSINYSATLTKSLSVFAGLVLGAGSMLWAQVEYPPVYGHQNAENIHKAHYELVFSEDFEGGLTDYTVGPDYELVTSPTEVIEGQQSLKLTSKFSVFQVEASSLNLIPNETYLVEIKYRWDENSTETDDFLVGFGWPGFDIGSVGSVSSPNRATSPASGTFRHTMRIGTSDQTKLAIVSLAPEITIDSLRVYRHKLDVLAIEPKPLTFGFPRLSNFHVYSAYYNALQNGTLESEYKANLALYDLVHGVPFAHSLGAELDFLDLRAINSEILILPYIQSFVAVLGVAEPVADSAGLLNFFNAGLKDEWFLKKPTGERLPELLYPDNFQMNHTSFGPAVDGVSFTDYVTRYITDSVMGAGLWDGLHFDQSEWYPNPLLGNADPFSGGATVLPPIDLDGDGVAEGKDVLHSAWLAAFNSYFDRMKRELGPSSILLGNPGELPLDPKLFSRMNGFMYEFFTPYQIADNGDWMTQNASRWYRYYHVLQKAERYFRAPQVYATQFHGFKLGTVNGELTENGLADRNPAVEARDYQRARFGLASTLLGNGFFCYDYVDNSTAPTIWFDEYSVNEQGVAEKSIEAKGYLGQPLASAEELAYVSEEVFSHDFEDGSPALPLGIFFNDNLATTNDPKYVISGKRSGLFTHNPSEGEGGVLVLGSSPDYITLEQGAIYQLVLDYRIIGYEPKREGAVISAMISDFAANNSSGRFQSSTVWSIDFSGDLEGHLRASARIENAGFGAGLFAVDKVDFSIDNIRLVKAAGGGFRRDFENGVVLVNPTSESVTFSFEQIQGPLARTNLRRISGSQVPSVNNGQAVVGDITLASGDGLILLADKIKREAMSVPDTLQVSQIGDSGFQLSWNYAGTVPAGYKVSYGIKGGNLTNFHLCGTKQSLKMDNLEPGTTYEVTVSAFDFAGQFGEASSIQEVTTSGNLMGVRPILDELLSLRPGEEVTLSVQQLNVPETTVNDLVTKLEGVEVFVNGIQCGIRSVANGEVTFTVPTMIAGNKAILRVVKDSLTSPSYWMLLLNDGSSDSPLRLRNVGQDNIELCFESEPNEEYWIEKSLDLINWQRVRKVVGSTTEMKVLLSNESGETQQFYRVIK